LVVDNKTVNKHRLEAERVGLTLVGPGRDSNYRTYRCNKCGSQKEIEPNRVRRKSFKCQKCFTNILEREAEEVGLTLIGAAKNSQYRTYRIIECGHTQEISTRHVRKGNFRCRRCKEDKHHIEAKNAGLTLLGPGKDAGSRNYRFDECSHEQEIATGAVRKKSVRCRRCLLEKLAKDATAAGLTLVGEGKNTKYRLCRFNDCGHKQEIATSNIRSQLFECGQCLNKKIGSEANAVGLILLGLGAKNSDYRIYRIKECGHEQEIRLDAVRTKSFRCEECLRQKHEEEANLAGLTIIGLGKNEHYRTYQFSSCGHRQEFQMGNVRRMTFVCNVCEETARDLPSNVYLLKIKMPTFEWLKIGYARDVASRIKQYGLLDGAKVSKIIVRPFDTGREAHQFEESIHIKYGKKRVAVGKMKKFHTRSGFDECYPTSLLEILSEEILKKQTS